ncbi:MAG: hypothetical protein KC910_19810 [Candidatus Eremiobacteraeota bacterium]|nr:hypothetical protein [Candidatus Eremiobacteraeota bacterium]
MAKTAAATAPESAGPSQAAAPTESVTLSPQARIDAAHARANEGWNAFQGAFGNLSEGEKKEVGGLIGQRYNQLEGGENWGKMSSDQQNELKWMAQADVASGWGAGKLSGMEVTPENTPQAQNYANLALGGQQYVEARGEYLNLGGAIGQ